MPSSNAVLADKTVTHALTLARLSAHESQEVLTQLRRLERDLVRDLTNANLTAFRKDRYERLLRQTRQTIRASYRGIRDTQAVTMQEVARLEGQWTTRALNQTMSEPVGVYIDLASVAWTPTQIAAIASNAVIDGAPSAAWWARQAADTQRRFATQVKQGLLRGETTDTIVRAVRQEVMPLSRAQATTLVRSSLSAVSADARMATYEQNKELIRAVRWLSTLDSRTTIEWCIPRSGKLYTLADHRPIGHNLPWQHGPGKIHFNCRSQAVSVLKSWSELAGRTLPDVPDRTIDERFRQKLRGLGWDEDRIAKAQRRTQASMDGQVSVDLDFQSWLRTKPATFQNDVLGTGKAELFRTGVVTSLAQLLDFSGHPLTLANLKRQFGVP